ncbi:MAG: HNH endonuclease [Proteobacteria bacterium]|nr:HNH endonuclease [Pseudomonadota bacterium]
MKTKSQYKLCIYDKHFEVAHIKPISEFSKDTLITIVNDPSNLIPLCPNCHWEFDNLNR